MSEALLDPEGSPLPFFPIAMAFDWISVVNGMLAEETVFEFTQGEVVFFRTASASVEPDITLFWEDDAGPPFLIVAEDGFPVTTLETSANVTIPPGARMEFMVKFETPGTYELRRAAWNAGIQGVEACTAAFNIPNETCVSYDVEQPIATIIVLPSDEIDTTELPSRVPEYSQVYKDMEEMEVVDTKTILMQMDSMFPLFQIPYDGPFVPPGVAFGMNDRLVTPHYRHGEVVAGTCEEWTVMSEPPSDFLFHPFHSHTVPFLVTHVNGEPVEKPFWRDVFGVGRNATIKICFNDRLQPGDYVLLHCHALTHHDVGVSQFHSTYIFVLSSISSDFPIFVV
jgi:FtsP/CotA-like multicopper oxidase with cupredoxin domain